MRVITVFVGDDRTEREGDVLVFMYALVIRPYSGQTSYAFTPAAITSGFPCNTPQRRLGSLLQSSGHQTISAFNQQNGLQKQQILSGDRNGVDTVEAARPATHVQNYTSKY